MKTKICTSCGYVGKPTTQGLGSFAVDVFIWMVFASFTLFTALLPLMIIPLAWTIFHIATYKTITCPQCENFDMVGLDSKKGMHALHHQHPHHS